MKYIHWCIWSEEEDAWMTSCDKAFSIVEGTPSDNGMKYCCYCGKNILESPIMGDMEDE